MPEEDWPTIALLSSVVSGRKKSGKKLFPSNLRPPCSNPIGKRSDWSVNFFSFTLVLNRGYLLVPIYVTQSKYFQLITSSSEIYIFGNIHVLEKFLTHILLENMWYSLWHYKRIPSLATPTQFLFPKPNTWQVLVTLF